MRDMEEVRARVTKRRRESRGQLDLFPALDLHNHDYFNGLRERYLANNANRILELLKTGESICYDDVWATSLKSPLIWPSDVTSQLAELTKAGRIEILGMKERQRVPKFGKGHRLKFLK